MNPAVALLIRDSLKIFSGYLVAKGLADDGTAEVIVAGLLALSGVVWTRIEKRKEALKAAPAPGFHVPLLALAAAFTLAFATTGCQTSGKMLATTVQTAGAAMEAWSSYVALGHATPEQEAQVKAAWTRFQFAEVNAEQAYLESLKTGNDSGFESAAKLMRANQAQLLALIDLFSKPK